MKIYTSTVQGYKGPDKLDVTVKSGDKVFAPNWKLVMDYKRGAVTDEEYRQEYLKLMRVSFWNNQDRWLEVLTMPEVTLCCYCKPGEFCHRLLLAEILEEIGRRFFLTVEYVGERGYERAKVAAPRA
jgi:uncharacterized protein YeaO (DUF488 family)